MATGQVPVPIPLRVHVYLISEPAFLAVHRSRAEPLLVAVTDSSIGHGGATMSNLQIMDTEGYGVRLVNLDGQWKFRASLDGLVLLTGHDYIFGK